MSVFDRLLHEVCMEGVHNVPEVRSVGQSPLRQIAWEEPHEAHVVLHHGPKLGHSQLIVERNADATDFVQLQKLLLFSQDFFEEVSVHHVLGRQVQLHCAQEVRLWLFTYSCRGSSG